MDQSKKTVRDAVPCSTDRDGAAETAVAATEARFGVSCHGWKPSGRVTLVPSTQIVPLDLSPLEEAGLKFGADLGKAVTGAGEALFDTLKDVVDQVIDCAQGLGEAARQCVSGLATVADTAKDRVIEVSNDFMNIATDTIPYPLIQEVYEILEAEPGRPIRRAARAKMWRLNNPHDALWRGDKPSVDQVFADSYQRPRGKTPLLFVHGLDYALAGKEWEEALEIFVAHFEEQARIFRSGNHSDQLELLFVSWDTELQRQDQDLIIDGLSGVLGGSSIASASGAILWGVLWLELERRARELSAFMEPFVTKMLDPTGRTAETRPFVVTHSLGSYAWSDMINIMAEEGGPLDEASEGARFSIGDWWTMQPAVRANAYLRDREFPLVKDVYAQLNSANYSITLWHSLLDYALTGPYLWANQSLAMGAVGAASALPKQCQLNITDLAGFTHGETPFMGERGYFRKVGRLIRQQLPSRLRLPPS
ncbi:MAG TPA: hypothetical protein VM869_34725 [Enhygromyxa sp.]|jgi:hypothetical protein|nr:hypothetical protein [Enhygromyxa sp.]